MHEPSVLALTWALALITWVLAVLLPGKGRHRAVPETRPAIPQQRAESAPLPRHKSKHAIDAIADRRGYGAFPAGSPARPYAPARYHFSLKERTRQRHRRAHLWLATVGIDAGPRRIHGMTVGGVR